MMSEAIDGNFIDRINLLVKKAGGQNAMARNSGLSLGAIQRYLKGGEPTRPAIISMAKSGGVSTEWLISGESQNNDNEGKKSASMNIYGFAETKQQGWYEEVPWQISSTLDWPDPDIFAVVTVSNSMKPEGIHKGHLCICSPATKPIKNDAVYIRKNDGTSSIKKYNREEGKWIHISGYFDKDDCDNQVKYEEQLNKEVIEQIAPVIYIKRRI